MQHLSPSYDTLRAVFKNLWMSSIVVWYIKNRLYLQNDVLVMWAGLAQSRDMGWFDAVS